MFSPSPSFYFPDMTSDFLSVIQIFFKDYELNFCKFHFRFYSKDLFLTEAKLFLQPAHIYAIRDAICQYPANFGHMSLKNITLDKQCFIKTRKGFMALAYDGDQRTLFYSENVTKSISKVQLKRGEYTKSIIKGIGEVKGENVYFCV